MAVNTFLTGAALLLTVFISNAYGDTQFTALCSNGTCLDEKSAISVQDGCGNNTEEANCNDTTNGNITGEAYSSTAVTVDTKGTKRPREASQCPSLPIIRLRNGKIRVLLGQRVSYACNNGFRLLGPSMIRCYQGEWSNTVKPRCVRPYDSCEPPEKILHGSIRGKDWGDGNTILYICDAGYSLLGSRERTCESGYWSGIEPVCEDDSRPLVNVAREIKTEFVDKVGVFSSDGRGRMIGREIEKIGLELIFLIDRSSSIDPIDFKQGIEFAKFLVDEFGIQNGINPNGTGTRIAIITFGDNADLVAKPTDENILNEADAKRILDNIQTGGGGTAMQSALAQVIRILPSLRKKAKKALFLLTDGQNNVGNIPPSDVAKDLRTNGIEIFTVGIGREVNRDELVSIASDPARSHVFLLNKFTDLSDITWMIRNAPTDAPPVRPKCGLLPESKGKKVQQALSGWPWLATIYVKHPPKRHFRTSSLGICSGSLICSEWVLTSAGCFYGEDDKAKESRYEEAYVTLGEDDLSIKEKRERNFRVSSVIFHPKFIPWSGADYDVALVKLASKVRLDHTYRPLCLPSIEQAIFFFDNDDARGSVAGWGAEPSRTFFEENFASAFSPFAQTAQIPIADDFAWKMIKEENDNNTFCAGSKIKWTCLGNLGSPLVSKDLNTNTFHIIGVLSNKKYCMTHCNTFSKIVHHLKWINDVTQSCQQFNQ